MNFKPLFLQCLVAYSMSTFYWRILYVYMCSELLFVIIAGT